MTPSVEAVPEPLRQPVAALVAPVLAEIAGPVPAPVKRIATFAPRRRAAMLSAPLAAALADESLRRRVATAVRSSRPDLHEKLTEWSPPNDETARVSDPAVVAYAWLIRSELYDTLVALLPDHTDHAGRAEQGGGMAALRSRLADAQAEVRSVRASAKQAQADLKAENTNLRQRLGEARKELVRERERTADLTSQAKTARDQVVGHRRENERVRRELGAQIDRLNDEIRNLKRAGHQDRELTNVRMRLLLDTLRDAAAGLRDELGLPAASSTLRPADLVGQDDHAGPVRSSVVTDGAWLTELLMLPNLHVIVDGYNVTKTAWPSAPLRDQRTRLATALGTLAVRFRCEITVVFDGAARPDSTPVGAVPGVRGVRVRFSPAGMIADDLIRELVAAEPAGRPIAVVSSDGAVAADIARAGARAVASQALIDLIG